jgi:nucleotidyltransferase substrate binding protein (TIGR01987 family)
MNSPSIPDIRWKQRFSNFSRALQTLEEAKLLADVRALSKLEQQGLIQGFEFTHELAWNVLKDYLEEQGFVGIVGSKNATRQAFKSELISDGEAWMDMIKARNLTSHTYNLDLAARIADDILLRFYPALVAMSGTFEALKARPDPAL